MDFWLRARAFAEEAAKKSQELTQNIASANFSDVVSEASKKSKELAEKSKELAAEALKRADHLTAQIKSNAAVDSTPGDADLEKYGVTDDLRVFVRGITSNTFQEFPLEDDSEKSDIPTISNVRQDLTEWQEKHAKLVLLTVKEISKLRYQLCPKVMKERKFWRVYFILVNSHVAPYEKRYMEEIKLKSEEKFKDDEVKGSSTSGMSSKAAADISKQKISNVKAAPSEQDLDVFLLGDLEDEDDGPDDSGEGFDDDFDKI